MDKILSEIDYDELINGHLLGVVKDALKITELYGLPGENHFYITFKTNVSGVEIPNTLKAQYPENMTIVLQHQFSDLQVDDDKFSVVLTFGGKSSKLVIPFEAISYFADPYAKFGLSFALSERASKLEDIKDPSDQKPEPAEVISIDRFRNKK